MDLFGRKKRAALQIAKAFRDQLHYELGLLSLEDFDRRPYALKMRFSQKQTTLAVYQRVLRAYAAEKKNPPDSLWQMVEAKCKTG